MSQVILHVYENAVADVPSDNFIGYLSANMTRSDDTNFVLHRQRRLSLISLISRGLACGIVFADMGRIIALFRQWGPAIVMMAAIFGFSSIPSSEMPSLSSWDTLAKKGAHALGYGLLAAAFWRAFSWERRLVWLSLLMAVLYAGIDELHQSLVPGRHPSPVDVGIDAVGSATALAMCARVKKSRAKDARG